ncbi:MAG: 2-phospho-L-lactate transferase [Chloroflexota bacterium]|nr:2-phospho-L-lactate transferase [Chloroflexota bacterium]MDE2961579.1 2-phospho-L-lactate transferase [Chloroflexota bacterium]
MTTSTTGLVLALAGGVGGAKLALGLSRILPPERLAIVVNTGDDEQFHGLHVSPDLDTMTYTLSGLYNPETGWGIDGDTFETLQMLNRLGADTWFNLGSRDFAMHIRRTELLAQGSSLSQVTAQVTANLGIEHPIIPMSDQPVRTVLDTDAGTLSMQEYFVKRRADPVVKSISYVGSADARPSPGFAAALDAATAIVICPSNPFLSVAPILAIPGVRDAIAGHGAPRVAVSPIVGGTAVRGPAGKIMQELGADVSVVGVAREYREICDVLVLDSQDANLADAVAAEGVEAAVMPTIMQTNEDKVQLAERVLALAADLENRRS